MFAPGGEGCTTDSVPTEVAAAAVDLPRRWHGSIIRASKESTTSKAYVIYAVEVCVRVCGLLCRTTAALAHSFCSNHDCTMRWLSVSNIYKIKTMSWLLVRGVFLGTSQASNIYARTCEIQEKKKIAISLSVDIPRLFTKSTFR